MGDEDNRMDDKDYKMRQGNHKTGEGDHKMGEGDHKTGEVLRTREHCFLYFNRPIFVATWTGDTHEETDVLPSNRQSEGSRCWMSSSRQKTQDKTSLIVEEMVDTRLSLIGKGQEW